MNACNTLLTPEDYATLSSSGYAQRRAARFPGVDVFETVYSEGFEILEHAHGQACITMVLSGSQTDCVDAEIRKLEPGSAIYHPFGAPHANAFTELTHAFELQLWLTSKARSEVYGGLDHVTLRRRGSLVRLMSQIFEESLAIDTAASLAMESLVYKLLAGFAGDCRSKREPQLPSWLMTAWEMIHDNLANPPTLHELGNAVDRHPAHVAEAFHVHFGCTVGEHVRETRLIQAKRLLAQSKLPIGEIAVESGFFDQSHFTNAFRRYAGVPPSVYRKKHS